MITEGQKHRLIAFWDKWIFESFQPRPVFLALIRIFYASYFLFFLVERLDWIAAYPDAFYEPALGLPRLFGGFPPAWFFHGLGVLSIVFLTGVLFGYKTKWATLGTAAVVLLFTSFAHSFGKINHMSLFLFFPAIMAFTNWGAALSIDAARRATPQKVNHWPLTLLAVLVGFSLFTSGGLKFLTGWLDLSTQAVESKLYSSYFAYGRQDLLAEQFFSIRLPWLWEIVDWSVVILEIAALPCVFFPRMFRFILGFFVFFHMGVLLMLNIDFSILVPIYAVFAHPATTRRMFRFAQGIEKKLSRFFQFLHPLMLIPIIAGLVALLYTKGSVYMAILDLLGVEKGHFVGLFYWGIAIVFVVGTVITTIRMRRAPKDAQD